MQKNRKCINKQRKREAKNRSTGGNMNWISGNRKNIQATEHKFGKLGDKENPKNRKIGNKKTGEQDKS